MKIKNLSQDLLNILFSYKLSDLTQGFGHRLYYWIPGEINSIEPGHGYWYHYRTLESELNQYGWTVQEYFDILILHINDTEDRPRCPYCGRFLEWSGRLTYGYGQDYWFESTHHFCSPSHRTLYMSSHPDEYQDFAELLDSGGNLNAVRRDPNKSLNNDNLERKINSMWGTWLSKGNKTDECSFYIGKLVTGEFKYGVTSSEDDRAASYKFKKLKVILTNSREYVGALEAQIKFELNNASESLPFIGYMSDFRAAFIRAKKVISTWDLTKI